MKYTTFRFIKLPMTMLIPKKTAESTDRDRKSFTELIILWVYSLFSDYLGASKGVANGFVVLTFIG